MYVVYTASVKAARKTVRQELLIQRESGLFARLLSSGRQGTANVLKLQDLRVEGSNFHNTAASSPMVRVAAILGNSCRREVVC